jgi:excisionase family DNA binding protein
MRSITQAQITVERGCVRSTSRSRWGEATDEPARGTAREDARPTRHCRSAAAGLADTAALRTDGDYTNPQKLFFTPSRRMTMIRQLNERQLMGLMDYLKGQFLEIIQWQDDSRDTLSWRFPDEDKEIKRGAQLIVRESQTAQFIYLGQFGDTFGPGKHYLTTDNIPILSTLKGWKYGFESPFKADIYYVNTRLFTGNKWGTANPIMMRDADFGIVRARAYGTFDFKVVDVKTFLKEVAGTDHHFRLDEFADTMRSRIVSIFTDALASAKVPVLDVAARYGELGAALLPIINPDVVAKYGLEITTFIVENVSVPPEVEQAIDKRSSMQAIGNLNDYVKFQMAEAMGKGGDGGGMANTAAQLGAGLAMGQQMMAAMGTQQTTPAAAGAVPPTGSSESGMPELLGVAEIAKVLGVADADVLATLEKGELKGKKIGSTWRVSKVALDEFLKS